MSNHAEARLAQSVKYFFRTETGRKKEAAQLASLVDRRAARLARQKRRFHHRQDISLPSLPTHSSGGAAYRFPVMSDAARNPRERVTSTGCPRRPPNATHTPHGLSHDAT